MKSSLSTLCYIRKENKYLMLHRTVKKNDVNKDKWIGVGGHFEQDESPEECLLREVWEETGYRLLSYRFQGIVTFVSGDGVTEYMHLFTSDEFTGEPIACDEGELAWVDIADVWNLNIWEGDKIFFRLIDDDVPFFSLKLVYNGKGVLTDAVLNGKKMELFDILNPDGSKTGVVRERTVAHREGSLHGTVHTWIVRKGGKCGYEVLLQKRSANKDSNPGCYDISSAGHVDAGDDFDTAAYRELSEELGIEANPGELIYIGKHFGKYQAEFHGKLFKDNELSFVYVYNKEVDIESLTLQEEELDSVVWMDYDECDKSVEKNTIPHCIYADEFRMVGEYLGIR